MEQNFNTINLDYIETKKVSIFMKIIAFIFILLFAFIPMYEFIIQFKPTIAPCTYGISGGCGCII